MNSNPTRIRTIAGILLVLILSVNAQECITVLSTEISNEGGKAHSGEIEWEVKPNGEDEFVIIDCEEELGVELNPGDIKEVICTSPDAPKEDEGVHLAKATYLEEGKEVASIEFEYGGAKITSVKLILDLQVYIDKGMDWELNPYDDGVFTEYDDIVCFGVIEGAEGKVSYEITGTKSGEIASGEVECSDNLCEVKIPSEKTQRGDEITCKMKGKNEVTSEKAYVALHNYILIKLNDPEVTNAKDQFNYYLSASALDEKTAKAIYRGKKCPVTLDDFPDGFEDVIENAKKACEEEHPEFTPEQIEECAVEMILKSNSPLVRPVATYKIMEKIKESAQNMKEEWNPNLDRVMGMSDVRGELGGFAVTNPPEYRDRIFLGSFVRTLAHEMGHTYGFTDEYLYKAYMGVENPPNPYPKCCIDSIETSCLEKGGTCIEIITEGGIGKEDIKCPDDQVPIGDINPMDIEAPGPFDSVDNYGCDILTNPEPGKLRTEVCCVPLDKVKEIGNNCRPLDKEPTNQCAGMPLPGGYETNDDLDKPFRSAMGGSGALDFDWRYPPGSPFPLLEE